MQKTDYHFRLRDALIGMQFLGIAFGALVLVPILTGLSPSVALFTAGMGTLIFQLITRGDTPPIFLGSSFAFIAPISFAVQEWGVAATLSGLVVAGCFHVVLSMLAHTYGRGFIQRLLPPVVIGPVIMSIGLLLSPVAVSMAMGKTADGEIQLIDQNIALIISFLTLFTTLLSALLDKGMMKLIPILLGIIVGYFTSIAFNVVNFDTIRTAAWFALPDFTTPVFNWHAILFILPIAIVPTVEHIRDMEVISRVTNRDYLKKPGLHKTLLGDGVSSAFAAFIGGPPNTTYSEVIEAVAAKKAYNPAIMTWAAIGAIGLAFVGKLGAVLSTIPSPVLGGMMLLLFGLITAIGIKIMVAEKLDFDCPRNLGIIAMILVFAVGGMYFNFGGVKFSGIGLGVITGIILNLVLPKSRGHDTVDTNYDNSVRKD